MKLTLVTALLFIFLLPAATAQKIGIDSKGKSIFTHHSREDARIEISTEEPLSISYLLNPRRFHYVVVKPGDATPKAKAGDTTVTKFAGTLVQLSMLNSGEIPMLTNLSAMRPGVGFKIGYQRSIEVFNNIDRIPEGYPGANTFGFNAILNMDNLKMYDTVKHLQENRYPITYGLEGNFTLFLKNKKLNSNWRKAIAINSSVTKTWNDDDLKSFQELSKVTVLPNVVALEDFAGRYGVLDDDVVKFRTAFSFPMYYKILNPIPYVVAIVQTENKPSYHFGLFTNFLTEPLKRQNYKIPTSLGIGIDWVHGTGSSSNPNIFLKGSISFGALGDD